MNHRFSTIGALVLIATLVFPLATAAQDRSEPENLQFFPKELTRAEVVAKMRHFSFALGVRCSHCHFRNEESGRLVYSSEENPNKNKARFMLRMMETINKELLPALEGRSEPAFEITCKTCHLGTARPRILAQEMLLAAHQDGAGAAIEKFDERREDYDNSGAYDFREWETNTVAEGLAEDGMHEDAITIYQMNLKRFPESIGIFLGIAESYEALEDIPAAIEAYEKALELNPGMERTRTHVDELKAGQ